MQLPAGREDRLRGVYTLGGLSKHTEQGQNRDCLSWVVLTLEGFVEFKQACQVGQTFRPASIDQTIEHSNKTSISRLVWITGIEACCGYQFGGALAGGQVGRDRCQRIVKPAGRDPLGEYPLDQERPAAGHFQQLTLACLGGDIEFLDVVPRLQRQGVHTLQADSHVGQVAGGAVGAVH